MITHASDDIAARSTIAFCRRLNEAKDRTDKPHPTPGISRIIAKGRETLVFRVDGRVEQYPAG